MAPVLSFIMTAAIHWQVVSALHAASSAILLHAVFGFGAGLVAAGAALGGGVVVGAGTTLGAGVAGGVCAMPGIASVSAIMAAEAPMPQRMSLVTAIVSRWLMPPETIAPIGRSKTRLSDEQVFRREHLIWLLVSGVHQLHSDPAQLSINFSRKHVVEASRTQGRGQLEK